MYKLNYYVPTTAKEKTKKALFDIGVGMFDNKPVGNANPTIGKLDTLEVLDEYKVEMICSDELIHKAVKTLKEVHPYEEVAYEVLKIEDI